MKKILRLSGKKKVIDIKKNKVIDILQIGIREFSRFVYPEDSEALQGMIKLYEKLKGAK